MTDIEKARLLKAREIAAAVYVDKNMPGFARETKNGNRDCEEAVISALSTLTLCDWQPPEDPDERAVYEIVVKHFGDAFPWEWRHKHSHFPVALVIFKAGKAAK